MTEIQPQSYGPVSIEWLNDILLPDEKEERS